MKYILRIFISLVAFLIAINITWVVYIVINQAFVYEHYIITCERFCVVPKIKNLIKANPQGDVEIKFLEFKKTDKNFVAEFEVVNNSPHSIYYTAYDHGKDEPSRIKANGVVSPSGSFCGTGLLTFHLHSGDSMRMDVTESAFYPHMDENLSLQFGYFYGFENDKDSKIYWSESFHMPKDLANKLKLQKKSNNYLNKKYLRKNKLKRF